MDIAKRSVRGSLVLFVGGFSSSMVNAISIILIARLLGPAQYGLYSLALVVPGILQLFLGLGVGNAMVRYSAYSISVGKTQDAKRFTLNAIFFLWITGLVLALLNFALASPLSILLLHRPDMTPYLQLMSLGIVGSTLLTTMVGVAITWNWVSLAGLSQISQAAIKLGFSPLLIVAGMGVAGALAGHIASLIVTGVAGTAIFYRGRLHGTGGLGVFFRDVRTMMRFGLPLYVGGLVAGLATYYSTLVLAAITVNDNAVFGFYQAAINFVLPVTLVSSSLVSSLFPAFASLDGIGGDSKLAFRSAYKFVAFLITPIIVFIFSDATYLVKAFYGASFTQSVPYLRLLALAYVPIAFGYTVHSSFFSGFDRPKLTLSVNLSGALTLVAGTYLIAIQLGYGVYGIIYATFLSYFAAWLVGTILAAKVMATTLDVKANGAILLASGVSFAATALLPPIASSSALTLLIDLVVFFCIYITLAPLAGAVSSMDLDVMEHIFGDLKLIGFLFGFLLRYERLMLSFRR
jgi:O-antigen/teichoic acid export membrane protein